MSKKTEVLPPHEPRVLSFLGVDKEGPLSKLVVVEVDMAATPPVVLATRDVSAADTRANTLEQFKIEATKLFWR